MKFIRDVMGGVGLTLVVLALMAPVPAFAVDPSLPAPLCVATVGGGNTACAATATMGCTAATVNKTCGTRTPAGGATVTCTCQSSNGCNCQT